METFKQWAESRGYKYWPGGYEAPDNYDTARGVMLRDGSQRIVVARHAWVHTNGINDIIGYHPKPVLINLSLTPEEVAVIKLLTGKCNGGQSSIGLYTNRVWDKIAPGTDTLLLSEKLGHTIRTIDIPDTAPDFLKLVEQIKRWSSTT